MSTDALKLFAAKYRPAVEVVLLLLAILAALWQFGGSTAARANVAEVSLETAAPLHGEQNRRLESLEAHQARDAAMARDVRAIRRALRVPADAGEDP